MGATTTFDFQGVTYSLGATEDARRAVAAVLPNGTVLGLEWTEAEPQMLRAVREIADLNTAFGDHAITMRRATHAGQTWKLYECDSLPLQWVATDESGKLFILPMAAAGWRDRTPYLGDAAELREVPNYKAVGTTWPGCSK